MPRLILAAAGACLLAFSGVAAAQKATNLVCTGCVGRGDLANNSVTTQKIADGTIKAADLANQAVSSAKIRNGTIALVDLNAELQDFFAGALGGITIVGVEGVAEGVAEAECPSDRIPVSASCFCDDANGARNLGVLFGCIVSGNGVAAGCFDEAGTFEPQLPPPNAHAIAVCMGATSVDGTPWEPGVAGVARSGAAPEGELAPAERAELAAERHRALQGKLAEFRRTADLRRQKLLERR